MGKGGPAPEDAPRPAAGEPAVLLPTPLHIAIWNGNEDQILRYVHRDKHALEAKDARGNRALHLALKFAHRNSSAIVKSLLSAGARVRSRDADGWKTVHHAIASENEELLRLLIQMEKKQAPTLLTQKIREVAPRLVEVPDFYCELQVDVATWIPGVSRFLPSDTVKIWKKDQDLRFDISLVGFEHGRWQRGNLSFLLLSKKGRFVCLDHDESACTNLLSRNTALSNKDVDKMVYFFFTTSVANTEFDVSEVVFEKKRSWVSRSDVHEDIGQWKNTVVYDMSGVSASIHIRQPQNKNFAQPASMKKKNSRSKDPLAVLEEIAATDEFTEVEIDPKSDHVVSMELAKGEQVTWKFSSDRYDVGFGVQFLRDENSDEWEQIVPLERQPSHEQEQSESFKCTASGMISFKWDNSYSVMRRKKLRFMIALTQEKNNSEELKADSDRHRVKDQQMSFQEWFGVAIEDLPASLRDLQPRRQIMVHTPPPCKTMSKSFAATVHMSEEFPLSVEQFLPVIEVLSKTTSAFESVKDFFSARLTDGFPVQFCFPLIPSVAATFRFSRMELSTPESSLFTIPPHYKLFEEDLLSPRTHHDVLQRAISF